MPVWNSKAMTRIAVGSTLLLVLCVALGLIWDDELGAEPVLLYSLLGIIAVTALVAPVTTVKAIDYRLRRRSRD